LVTFANAFEDSFSVENNQDEIIILKQKIDVLSERLDGLTTLLEGLSIDIEQLKQSKQNPKDNTIDSRLNILETKVDLLSQDKQKESTKENLSFNNSESKKLDKPKPPEIQPSKLYTQGVRLFLKHKYNDAKKNFEITDKKNYKRASSNYYLGEIAYYKKEYKSAISHFKKSVQIYDKASYNDKLLLHTAISLEKINDIEQARVFYEMIIDSYPDKSSAIVAKENLTQL
jgi:TolA-binding protein